MSRTARSRLALRAADRCSRELTSVVGASLTWMAALNDRPKRCPPHSKPEGSELSVAITREDRITQFIRVIFDQGHGYLCIARIYRPTKEFAETFFQYPEELFDAINHIVEYSDQYDMYFCPQLFERKSRTKEAVIEAPCAWADLDTLLPTELLVQPTALIESSDKRYQGFWLWTREDHVDPGDAEEISRRIAYYHADKGADRSGWDLTQLLRIPDTTNHKYINTKVKLVRYGGRFSVGGMKELYPPAKGFHGGLELPLPTEEELTESAEEIMERHRKRIPPMGRTLFHEKPELDWSSALWQLQMILFESGMTPREVYIVSGAAACNKYKRDGKPTELLWKEVCRSYKSFEERHKIVSSADVHEHPILTDQERRDAENNPMFVEEYIEWAKTLGDAAWQYHQAGAFIVLSSLLAGPVRLPTSFGTVVPNLWFMILADTTLTRKTTAMDISIDLLSDISSNAILATDGSIEGLFTSLSMRPGKPSVFLRDEFSGLLEAMSKKDYYAGMAEAFTKLYDGKLQKRVLRKEIIEVRDPVLIIFAGGIKTRMLALLEIQHVVSGFLPRFVFITAESDITKLRPLGPPTEKTQGRRNEILNSLSKIHDHYQAQTIITVDKTKRAVDKIWDATVTDDAWDRYNQFENDMMALGLASQNQDIMTPVMDRLSKSTLKAAILIAAASRLDERVVVEEQDLVKAMAYCEQWRGYAIEVIQAVGTTTQENQLLSVLKMIIRRPGILRSEVMQHFHLRARETDVILETLEQRGLMIRTKSGRSERLQAIGD